MRTWLGDAFSEGARLLWLELDRRQWNANMLRKELKTSKGGALASGLVNGWLYGDRVPTLFYVLQIKRLFGVPAEAWQQKPFVAFTLSEAA